MRPPVCRFEGLLLLELQPHRLHPACDPGPLRAVSGTWQASIFAGEQLSPCLGQGIVLGPQQFGKTAAAAALSTARIVGHSNCLPNLGA